MQQYGYHWLTLIFIFSFQLSVTAQDAFKVQRCADIDRSAPITNIYIDEKGNKWVGDYKGVYLAQSPDYASVVATPADQWALLSVRDGNEELVLPIADLRRELGEAFDQINTAFFDKRKEELWIGTADLGAFRLQTEPSLKLIEEVNSGNSKLRSDFINTIYMRPGGEIWLGSDEGALAGKDGKWRLVEKFFAILRIADYNGKMYLLSDGQVLEIDNKDKGYILTIEDAKTEGEIKDIAFDSKGRLWIASEIVTRFDIENRTYETFGPAREFTSQFVNCIAVDADDAAWVGTEDKGVYFIGSESTLTIDSEIIKALSCQAGAEDATVEVRVSGGKPPYTYQWDNGNSTTQRLENIGAGDYQVTVTDTEGNKIQSGVSISDESIQLDLQQVAEASNGESDGSATVTAERSADSQFQYKWDNGETTATAKSLAAGEHTVTISDGDCQAVGKITISEGLKPLAVEVENVKNISCPDASDAELLARATGGEKPYSYRWNIDRLQGDNPKSVSPGIYQLFVTDAAGNKATANVEVDIPQDIAATVSVIEPSAADAENGKAEVVAKGGAGNYSFQWDSGATTSTANNLSSGEHTVTVTDANGCSTTTTFNMSEDAAPMKLTLNQTEQINCSNDANASIQAIVEGGVGPYKYYWNGQPANKVVGRLPAAEYTVRVKDAEGNSVSETINVIAPDDLIATATIEKLATTNNTDGEATITVTGGTEPYAFAWSTGDTLATVNNLAPASHTVTITDSRGCTTETTIDISEDVLPLAVTLEQTNPLDCNGEGATLEVSLAGGKAPFEYAWNENGLTGETVNDITAGAYNVTVTDAEGTIAEAQFTIADYEQISVTAQQKSPASTNQTDGQATADVKGGSGEYTYAWDNGTTTATAENLAAGSYSVTVTDASGCTATAEVEITEDILPLTAELEIIKNISCATENDASLKINTQGGKAPFTYSWSESSLENETAENLAAGDYVVTVSDAAGNSQTAQISIPVPDIITATVVQKTPASTGNSDGVAEVSATGGTGNYQYAWDNGSTTAEAENLTPETHVVTITDENGCTATAEIEISEDILPLVAEASVLKSVDCPGGNEAAVNVVVNGGKKPFEYAWNISGLVGGAANNLSAGDYEVTVTDAEGTTATINFNIADPAAIQATATVTSPASTGNSDGIAKVNAEGGSGSYTYNWSSGSTTNTAENLPPSVHSVTVTDENGCTAIAEVTIDENILPLTAEAVIERQIDCLGNDNGSAKIEVTGGKGPFDYKWRQDDLTGASVSNLKADKYVVTVTDAEETTTSVTFTIEQPLELKASVAILSPASTGASDGAAEANAVGGADNYTFKWSNGATTAKVENLAPDTYIVTVTDANGCFVSESITIDENILPLIAQAETAKDIDCNGAKTAAVDIKVTGGKGPYTYQWEQENLGGNSAKDLAAGEYFVTVIDSEGTQSKLNFNIVEPDPIRASASLVSPATTDNSDGTAVVKAEGGAGNFTFAWDNGEALAIATALSPEQHTVTVTDENGCAVEASVAVNEDILPISLIV
ncbi:MAG: hypothetical protein AB8G22_13300, partial [Saprospiraceae bacterium]